MKKIMIILAALSMTACPPSLAVLNKQDVRQYAVSLVRDKHMVMAVAIVTSMAQKSWTNGDPPSGKLRLVEIIEGPNITGEFESVWAPDRLEICESEANYKQQIKHWTETPIEAPAEGSKVIVLGRPGASGTIFMVEASFPYNDQDRQAIISAISLIRQERQEAMLDFESADLDSLCKLASDIVIARPASKVDKDTINVNVIQSLKSSARQKRQPNETITLSTSAFPSTPSFNNGAILFLEAPDNAGFVPINHKHWALPNTSKSVSRIKQTLRKSEK